MDVAYSADTPREALIEQMARGGYSRLPVYRQDLDDVIGILHATDLLRAMASGDGPVNAAALAREALTVPETLSADNVLAEMRRRGVREALVIDEYGGTAGLVTFESLMERIVGNLGSGFGGAKALINVLADGSAEIDGLVLAADVNEQFLLHIDQATYTTVGGYVLGRLGRRPRVGDTIDVEGRRMRVDALDGLRVAKVWLSKPMKSSTTEDTEAYGGHGFPLTSPVSSVRSRVLRGSVFASCLAGSGWASPTHHFIPFMLERVHPFFDCGAVLRAGDLGPQREACDVEQVVKLRVGKLYEQAGEKLPAFLTHHREFQGA